MPRPLVAVFQEYANLTLPTPAQAELNTCVVGVAKQVVDFDSTKPSDTEATRVDGGALTYMPKGVIGGAVVESAEAYLLSPKVVVQNTAAVTYDASDSKVENFLWFDTASSSSTGYYDVSAGQYVYAKDALGDWHELSMILAVYEVKATAVTTVSGGASSTVTTTVTTDLSGLEKPVTVVSSPVAGTASAPSTVTTKSYHVQLQKDLSTAQKAYLDGVPGTVRVVKTLSGAYKVGELFRELDEAEGTVSLSPITSLSVRNKAGTANVNVAVQITNEGVACESVHLEYVARRTDLAYLQTITDANALVTALGKLDKRNPLALAAWLTLQNSGTSVMVYGVAEDSLAAYGAFQRVAFPRSDIYCIVPVCLDKDIQLALVEGWKAKLANMSDAQYALDNGVPQRFKMVVAGGFPAVRDPRTVYTLPTETAAADIDVEPFNGKYRVRCPGATFYSAGVRPGDSVTDDVTLWYGDNVAKVVQVVSETVLVLDQNISPTTSAYKIVRKLVESEVVTELSAVPKGIASRRVIMVLGDGVTVPAVAGDEMLPAAYLACAVGGMIAGLPPHSGLTNLSVAGIADVMGTHDTFSEENLSTLSDAGWCIFIEDTPAAAPYCLHGVTTDPSALEFSEIMSVKNFDYISATLHNSLTQFIGTWNINPETIGYINNALSNTISVLVGNKSPKLGAPLLSGSIDSLSQSSLSADRVEIYVTLRMPKSLNTIGLHLVSA